MPVGDPTSGRGRYDEARRGTRYRRGAPPEHGTAVDFRVRMGCRPHAWTHASTPSVSAAYDSSTRSGEASSRRGRPARSRPVADWERAATPGQPCLHAADHPAHPSGRTGPREAQRSFEPRKPRWQSSLSDPASHPTDSRAGCRHTVSPAPRMPVPGCRTCSPWVGGHVVGALLRRIRCVLDPGPRAAARFGSVAAQLTADRRGRASELRGHGPHASPGQAQIGDLQPLVHAQVPPRGFGLLARNLSASRLAPTPPGSSIHPDSVTGRLQCRASSNDLPEPSLLLDQFLPRPHPQHLTSIGVLQRPIELADPAAGQRRSPRAGPQRSAGTLSVPVSPNWQGWGSLGRGCTDPIAWPPSLGEPAGEGT